MDIPRTAKVDFYSSVFEVEIFFHCLGLCLCVFSKFYECKFSTPFLKITIHSKRTNSTPKNRVMPLEKNIFPDSLSSELPDVERTRVVVVVVVVVGRGGGGGGVYCHIWAIQACAAG